VFDRKQYLKQWQIERYKKHPSFINWFAMLQRCNNPNHNRYASYGGRGIQVHPAWRVFKTYEKEFGYSKPGPGYTVDRIDNDGAYEPSNVQWLTKAESTRKQNLQRMR